MGGQLQMLWPEGRPAPRAALPDGYELRALRPGDGAAHAALMRAAGFQDWDEGRLRTALEKALPAGVFLIVRRTDGAPAATAMALHHPAELHPAGGELGWVAADPAQSGRGLGRVAAAAAVSRLLAAGYARIYLRTDDSRLAALKTYLRLGFQPFLCAPDMEARWREVCARLSWPFAPEEWPRLGGAAGPAASAPADAGPLRLSTPFTEELARSLRAGQRVLLSGTVYVARDAAHKRMVETLAAGGAPPFDPAGQVIYYAGPTPARPGRPIGSVGPTTSSRMDGYLEPLLRLGLRGTVGKGARSAEVKALLARHGAVYLAAAGGAGALLAARVAAAETIAYPELGPEALRRLRLDDFPALVACDAAGGDWYQLGPAAWRSAT